MKHLLKIFCSYKEFIKDIDDVVYVSTDITNKTLDFNFIKVETFDSNFELLYKQLVELSLQHYTVYIGLSSSIHYKALKQFFEQKDIFYREVEDNMSLKEGINISNTDYNIGLDFIFILYFKMGVSGAALAVETSTGDKIAAGPFGYDLYEDIHRKPKEKEVTTKKEPTPAKVNATYGNGFSDEINEEIRQKELERGK